MFSTRSRKWLTIFGAALVVSACGGKEAKQESASAPALGETQRSAGEAKLKTERQVTRTITSESDIPTVRSATVKGDINRMDEKNFVTLGFPKTVAKNIVQYREDHGPFRSVDELDQVQGVDDRMLSRVRDKLGASRSK